MEDRAQMLDGPGVRRSTLENAAKVACLEYDLKRAAARYCSLERALIGHYHLTQMANKGADVVNDTTRVAAMCCSLTLLLVRYNNPMWAAVRHCSVAWTLAR